MLRKAMILCHRYASRILRHSGPSPSSPPNRTTSNISNFYHKFPSKTIPSNLFSQQKKALNTALACKYVHSIHALHLDPDPITTLPPQKSSKTNSCHTKSPHKSWNTHSLTLHSTYVHTQSILHPESHYSSSLLGASCLPNISEASPINGARRRTITWMYSTIQYNR